MNKPTYCVVGVSQELGIGKNKTVRFPIYESNPPMIGSHYYARELGCGVLVQEVIKIK